MCSLAAGGVQCLRFSCPILATALFISRGRAVLAQRYIHSTIEYTMALDSAPFTLSQNSQFFRPTTNGRIAFSARLLEIGTSEK